MNSSVSKIELENKTIYLVKTAHISAQSVEDVKNTIQEVTPSTVCIELDAQRARSFSQNDQWEKTDIISIIKKKQIGLLISNLILSSYQKKMAKQLNISVGAEMIEAMNQAKNVSARISYIDRDIQITFKRIYRLLTFSQKFKLLIGLFSSLFDEEKITDEQLENLKQSDMIDSALSEMGKSFPIIKQVLVDERDQYMAQKIKQAIGSVIVAVVGAAHAPGIQKHLLTEHSLKDLEVIPEKRFSSKIIGWLIPIVILAAILISFSFDSDLGLRQIQTWILFNGVLSAIGTALVLGHPLSILTAFIAAPISSLSPLLAAGWFAGIVEAIMRKPTVKDFQTVGEDINSLKGFYRNKVLRVLLVVIMANLFSSIGTLLSSMEIFKSLFEQLG